MHVAACSDLRRTVWADYVLQKLLDFDDSAGQFVGLSSYNGDYDAYYGAYSCSLDEGRQGAGIS